ncbi:hypothetical protein OG883_42030 [Streptomyces sp. NBC_01142]|uniref:hypothetical protein n=1 Tax=Streptomyces sp. NBC_01142 TaxID=2975865 RepID=UPI00224E6E1E|nr:hypothetical protein [Streptomyces sp. NBC_01142]MCX4826240.1 hypothetical protein [Streptomyces sp. NBC_01142]
MEESSRKRCSKPRAHLDRWRASTHRHLRKWIAVHGQSVQHQLIHGAAYTLGSGAVSLIIVWVQSRY